MTTLRPLTTEKYAPCMECGSVQCAVCSDHLISAVALLKEKIIGGAKYPARKRIIELIDECFQIGVKQ